MLWSSIPNRRDGGMHLTEEHLEALREDCRDMTSMFAALRKAVTSGETEAARLLVRLVGKLAEDHFRREGAMLRRHGFPRLRDHAISYEATLIELEILQDNLTAGNCDRARCVKAIDILDGLLLDAWDGDWNTLAFLAERLTLTE